ncbi:MAG: YbjN domain-containing protein [Ruminococcus sp.]|nr:YbjN domain-containing protein [Ruminococcus sp.]
MDYSKEIAECINKTLIDDDWNFEFNREKGVFRFDLNIKSKIKNLFYIIKVNEDDFVIYAISPVSSDVDDADIMAEMAEFLTRANYGLRCGNFEMDYDDGEIRYRVYVDCEDNLPGSTVIMNGIVIASATFQRYANGITGIIFGGMDAEEACDMCEN